ncbi:type VI secretion system baseplate subunit TssG [Photobacterium indicum]|jgi:type VI secretion system protein ImpH|uniref:Type VI secretion protein VasB-1 n=1 Tax=Photobacterium indicum TaxID=81447 RepID=A0A2T3LCU5_9GAMM|nr:type VI secretion system baseplate subunit TssG [Photobacterium indicum]PSV49203.1 type VI secretion protein VasB-1 [Photobacterium indicum]
MQESPLVRFDAMQNRSDLERVWQWFKHKADHLGVRPNVRFSVEQLPAHYHSQVTQVYADRANHYVVKTSLPGLSGSQASMPRSMYQQALVTKFDLGNEAAVEFFDTFNNRYFRLYCQAQLKHDLTSQMEEETFAWNRHQHSLTSMLASLCGVAENSEFLPQQHLVQYTGLLGLKLTCPISMKALLEDYFEAEFQIDHSELEYQPLTPCSLSKLGKSGQNTRLGMGALLGKTTPMLGQKLSIKIRPKDYRHYLAIRQDRKMIKAIDHLVRSYMGINIKYNLYMSVNSQYLPRVKLTSIAEKGVRIGQSAWMNSRENKKRYVDMPLTIS